MTMSEDQIAAALAVAVAQLGLALEIMAEDRAKRLACFRRGLVLVKPLQEGFDQGHNDGNLGICSVGGKEADRG